MSIDAYKWIWTRFEKIISNVFELNDATRAFFLRVRYSQSAKVTGEEKHRVLKKAR